MALHSRKGLIISCLIAVATLHGLIFATAQDVERFVSSDMAALFKMHKHWLTLALYFSATLTALLNQWWSRIWGIKKILLTGLTANFIGLAFFYLCNLFAPGSWISYATIFCGMILLGSAIASIATVLATYVVIEFPKYLALGLILLYSCLDVGIMVAMPLLQYFSKASTSGFYLITLAVLMGCLMLILRKHFKAPEVPRQLDVLRQGSLLWKELRHRMGFFIVGMVFYGMIEYTFNIMGFRFLKDTISAQVAGSSVFFFWLALTLGQIALGVPAFWIRPANVLKILPLFILLALILIPFQTDPSSFLLVFIIGGIGCSAVFPLLISMIQLDLLYIDRQEHTTKIIPYVEAACGYMVASYSFGIGLIALASDFIFSGASGLPLLIFNIGIGLAVALWLLVLYLDKTSPQKTQSL
jgi:hypothetical protein